MLQDIMLEPVVAEVSLRLILVSLHSSSPILNCCDILYSLVSHASPAIGHESETVTGWPYL